MPVQYYSLNDSGAPEFKYLSGGYGAYKSSIIEVLDTILMTGYGSKPGFGWTKQMTSTVPDSNRTVYKNHSAHQDDPRQPIKP